MNRTIARNFRITVPALLLFVGISTVGCTKDEEVSQNPEGTIALEDITPSMLVGTWYVTSISSNSTTTTEFNGETITVEGSTVGKDIDITQVFSTNPNILEAFGSYTAEVTSELQGQTIKQDSEVPYFESESEWTLLENKIIIESSLFGNPSGLDALSEESIGEEYEIIEMTENTMVLKSLIETVIELPSGINNINVEVSTTLERAE